jgi:hypothetical protein
MTFKNEAQARNVVRRERSNFRLAKETKDVAAMAAAQRKHNEAMTFLRGNGSSN